MKVIKKGKDLKDQKAEWTCKYCHAVIQSNKAEGKVGPLGHMIYMICPECKKECDILLGKFS